MFVEKGHVRGKYVFLEAGHDLDARQVSPVHRAVETLAREGLLVDVTPAVTVEEATELLQFGDDPGRVIDQHPSQFLVVDERTALDGVFEVLLERVVGVQHGVVAALHHPGAAALPYLPLGHHDDMQAWVLAVGVQRGHQPGPSAAYNQYVCVQVAPAWRSETRMNHSARPI